MALETVFAAVDTQLRQLQETLIGLRTTAVEDKPADGDVVLVDLFGDAADDLLGLLEAALDAVHQARHASATPADLQCAWQALTVCQAQFNQINYRFGSDLLRYERIAELLRFGRSRGGEWRAWAISVKAALDWCRQPLFEVNEALFVCWQELTERLGVHAVTVHTSNIGQQLTLSTPPRVKTSV